jgi:hypothetical protein
MHKIKVGLEAARADETYRCHPALEDVKMYVYREMSLHWFAGRYHMYL